MTDNKNKGTQNSDIRDQTEQRTESQMNLNAKSVKTKASSQRQAKIIKVIKYYPTMTLG